MENEYPISNKTTCRADLAPRAESAILGEGRGNLGTFKQHLPDILVRRAKELAHSLVLGRVELPQIEHPLLTREDPADEHDLDYVDKLELPVYHILDAGLESGRLYRIAPGQTLLFPGG